MNAPAYLLIVDIDNTLGVVHYDTLQDARDAALSCPESKAILKLEMDNENKQLIATWITGEDQ